MYFYQLNNNPKLVIQTKRTSAGLIYSYQNRVNTFSLSYLIDAFTGFSKNKSRRPVDIIKSCIGVQGPQLYAPLLWAGRAWELPGSIHLHPCQLRRQRAAHLHFQCGHCLKVLPKVTVIQLYSGIHYDTAHQKSLNQCEVFIRAIYEYSS